MIRQILCRVGLHDVDEGATHIFCRRPGCGRRWVVEGTAIELPHDYLYPYCRKTGPHSHNSPPLVR